MRRALGQAAQQTMRRYTWSHVAQKLEKVLALAAHEANGGGRP